MFSRLGLGVLLIVVGCGHDWDGLGPVGSSTGNAPTTGGGGTGGVIGGGQGGVVGGGGVGGTVGGTGGVGGMPMQLVDDELIARYYLDEAASGMGPTQVIDHAPTPQPLLITYSPGMQYVEVDGHRGLGWDDVSLDGRASIAMANSKLTALDGATQATTEVVARVDGADPSSSRLTHIGQGSSPGEFTTFLDSGSDLGFDWEGIGGGGAVTADWWTSPPLSTRFVMHVVLDTQQAAAEDRLRLFLDGVEVTTKHGGEMAPELDQAVTLLAGSFFVLGNREIGGRSIDGELYYAAIYAKAFSDAEVAQNAQILASSDDAP